MKRAETLAYLKVGTMAVVLSMVEDDFIDRDRHPNDVFGHGTHVSGTIAGNDAADRGGGVALGLVTDESHRRADFDLGVPDGEVPQDDGAAARQIERGEFLDDFEEKILLRHPGDLLIEREAVHDLAHVLRKAIDVRVQVRRELIRIAEEFR